MNSNSKKTRSVSPSSGTPETKILIIDNDSVVAEMLTNYLGGKKKFRVLSAETGSDGIQQAIKQVPDVILLDTRLSDMSGLQVHEQLKKNPVTSDIPVIYTSAFSSLRIVEQATRQGAKGFITKPFTMCGIYTKMASVLHHP